MNELVLNPHQNRPPGIIPTHWATPGRLANHVRHCGTNLLPIGFDLGNRWPIVIGLVQIIPTHLIHTNSKNRLKAWVDPFRNQLGQ